MNTLPKELTCSLVPETRGLVVASGQDSAAVRAKGHRPHTPLMFQGCRKRLTRGRVPKSSHRVFTRCQESTAIRTKGRCPDARMGRQPDLAARAGIPQGD